MGEAMNYKTRHQIVEKRDDEVACRWYDTDCRFVIEIEFGPLDADEPYTFDATSIHDTLQSWEISANDVDVSRFSVEEETREPVPSNNFDKCPSCGTSDCLCYVFCSNCFTDLDLPDGVNVGCT